MTDLTDRCEPDQVTGAQARAAHITYRLVVERRAFTTEEIMEETGIRSVQGVHALMNNLSCGRVPVYNPAPGKWSIVHLFE
ncbi:MAG: hypothetical protein KA314_05060 [Chloroflexi bacterium]|nr:hypothetical protein [Chloroflexota bacterium]